MNAPITRLCVCVLAQLCVMERGGIKAQGACGLSREACFVFFRFSSKLYGSVSLTYFIPKHSSQAINIHYR